MGCSRWEMVLARKYEVINYTTPHHTTLHYATLHYTTRPHTTPHHTAPHHTTTHHTTPNYTTLPYTILHYTTLHLITWYGHMVRYPLSQSVTSFLPSSALIVWADIVRCRMIWPYRANWRSRPPLSCIGGLNLYTWLEEKTGVTTCKVLMWPPFWNSGTFTGGLLTPIHRVGIINFT